VLKNESNIGFLLVITGPPASGKDTVMNEFLKHKTAKSLNVQKVVTNTDRKIREGELPAAYHFVSRAELDRMDKSGELVEQIVQTGVSRKATSKVEIERLFLGENLIWRIDPSLAAKIVTGKFFNKHFPKHSEILMENTLVVCINAPKEVLELRRKRREGKNYNRKNFTLRDEYETPHLDILQRKALVIDNLENRLTETVEVLAQLVKTHHAKIKNKKI
jgi:guanylate kinase